jgi:bacillithiol system protein YtxJ
MNWIKLISRQQLEQLKQESQSTPVLIFKHSTRCSTSRMSLDRLERNWNHEEMNKVRAYFLDLLNYREVSNAIAEFFGVEHESPQVLVISNGESILDLSHFDIDYQEIVKVTKS